MDIKYQLRMLPTMSKPQLVCLWGELFGNNIANQLRRDLTIRILAYRLQEQELGGLKKVTQRHLQELARRFETNPKAEIPGVPAIKPGTRLIREWRGQTHHVTVVANGYEYRGKRYSSLSEIARLIAGTRWSGPLFFGLRSHKRKGSPHGQHG